MYRFLDETVADHMTRPVKTASRAETMAALQRRFAVDDFNTYPVVDSGEVVGIVTKFDFLKIFAMTPARMVPRYDDLMKVSVGEAMTPEFIYVTPVTRLTRVLQLMVEHRIRSIPVIQGERDLVGIISREDVMRALQLCEGRDC
ncbi:MAG: CBS domain-containing protein [Pseudomonadota bacterium]